MPNRTRLSIEEITAIVQEAHRYNIRATAHAMDNQSVYNAVVAGVDGIEHGYPIEDTTLDLMAKKGTILVPTDGDSVSMVQYVKLAYPGNDEILKNIIESLVPGAERLRKALQKGVIIAAGSDDYIDFKMPFAEPSKRTLIGYFESGISIPKILQFATFNAAIQLGWDKRVGKLKKGFLSDIIAVDNDLEKNIYAIMNVHFVMKDGKVFLNK